MSDRSHEFSDAARESRAEGNLEEAAGYYCASAYAEFSRMWRLPGANPERSEPDGLSHVAAGRGVERLLLAALCYRLAGELDRCRNRCRQGELVVTDLLNHDPSWQAAENHAPAGLANELIGDFRLFGDLGGHETAYDTAREHYEQVDHPKWPDERHWQDESEFTSAIAVLVELADSAGYGISEETIAQIRDYSLLDRIDFKRDHYERIVEAVLKDGNWESDVI